MFKLTAISFIFILIQSGLISCEDYDDGSYREDNSGQYIPDDSGKYIPDHSGLYSDDGTGRYSGEFDRSRYNENRRKNFINSNFLENSETNQGPVKPIKNVPKTTPTPRTDSFYNTNFLLNSQNGKWRILKQNTDLALDKYNYEYETENRILASETGKIVNRNGQNGIMETSGFFQYTGPDNVIYSVRYKADENGFQPEAAHLPTPPPIPEILQKTYRTLSSRN